MKIFKINVFSKLIILFGMNYFVAQAVFASNTNDLTTFTEKGMQLWHVPGMSVAVVSKDKVLFQQGFGSTSVKSGKQVDTNTLFSIASTTKAMVVAGILILADEDKLSLDDPIIKHIPELHFKDPSLTQQLTIRDLLSHRTGMPSTDFWSFFQDMPLDEQIRRLQSVEAAAPIRTRLIYQNTMFEIAGLVIKRITGKAWEQFLTERLWQPIGMQNTFGDRSSIGDKSHVMPYLYNNEKLSVAKWDFADDYANAAGSVWSSIHDMSLWAQFLLRDGVTQSGKILISKSSIKQMFEPNQLASASDFYPTTKLTKPNWRSYGLGWFQQDFQGRKIDFHTGSLSGLIALIGLDRENDKAVIVLGNRDHAEMRHALLWEVMDNTISDTRRDWNQEIFDLFDSAADSSDKKWQETQENRLKNTKPALSLSAYAGDYENESFGDIQLVKKGKKLTLKTKLIDFNMSYWHLDTYLIEKKSWKMKEFVTFNISADGKVTSFNVFGETFQRKKAEQVTE